MMTDPIADMLTRIRNANLAMHDEVIMPSSKLKEALAAFREMQMAYAEAVSRVADAASGSIQRELRALVGQGPLLGLESGARAATVMTELANRVAAVSREGATTGLDAAKDYGARMSMVASGVLAGIADALQEPSAGEKKE